MRTAERQHSCSAAKIDHLPVRATTGHSSLCTGTVTCGTLPHAGQRASAERSRSGACSRTQRNHAMTLRQLRPSCSLACVLLHANSTTGQESSKQFRFRTGTALVCGSPPPEAPRPATSRAAARTLMPPICLSPTGHPRTHGPRTRESVPRQDEAGWGGRKSLVHAQTQGGQTPPSRTAGLSACSPRTRPVEPCSGSRFLMGQILYL